MGKKICSKLKLILFSTLLVLLHHFCHPRWRQIERVLCPLNSYIPEHHTRIVYFGNIRSLVVRHSMKCRAFNPAY